MTAPPVVTPPTPTAPQPTPAVDPKADFIEWQLLTYARDNAKLADLERQADLHGRKSEDLYAERQYEESTSEGQLQVAYRRQHLDAVKEIQELKRSFQQFGKSRVYPVRDKLLEDVKTPSEYRKWLFDLDLF